MLFYVEIKSDIEAYSAQAHVVTVSIPLRASRRNLVHLGAIHCAVLAASFKQLTLLQATLKRSATV